MKFKREQKVMEDLKMSEAFRNDVLLYICLDAVGRVHDLESVMHQ